MLAFGFLWIGLMYLLSKWSGHPLPFLSAVLLGGWRAALLAGLAGLAALEIARLAGSAVSLSLWQSLQAFVGIAAFVLWLLVGVAGIVVAGVQRRWLIGLAMLIPPAMTLGTNPFFRGLVADGILPLNWTLVALVAFVGGTVAAPRIRAVYKSELADEEEDRQRQREREEKQHVSDEKQRASEEKKEEDKRDQAALEASRKEAEERLARQLTGVGVALSGGGHRATLFGLGVLLYLARAGRHRNVTQMTSVSGGSLTSAYVAQSLNYQSCSSAEFDKVAGELAGQIADRGTLFAIWQAKAFLVLLSAVGLSALLALLLLVWRPAWLPYTWLTLAAPVALVIVFGRILQSRGRLCEKAFAKTLFSRDGKTATLAGTPAPPLHVICATEVQTGNGAYFLRYPFNVREQNKVMLEYLACVRCDGFQTTIRDFPLAAVVQSSAALPFAFPTVKMPISGWRGITRRKRSQVWENVPASHMLLVDGGVRDNLGVEWFDAGPKHLTHLVVVSGAANRVHARERRTGLPLLGEMMSLILVKDLPYNTREQNRRQELLRRLLPAYEGSSKADLSGAIVHIDESPYDLAETVGSTLRNEAIDHWLNAPEDMQIAKALEQNPAQKDFEARAQAVRRRLEESEDVPALREKAVREAKEAKQSEHWIRLLENKPNGHLVADEWERRALRNANVRTTLSRLGRQTSAELMRHAFALAMAKLHTLLDYPLCDIPSIAELEKLMDANVRKRS
jgi:predicted acylesterase/phospholipase RssA